ncbi:MAG: hypothetical protein LUF25_04685 [Phascolarctobacterium sp.]|nr:hypothetical protein [Phascolarctobacterium sp.]
MEQKQVSQRIRTVKSSLENAEQNFLDNNGMRGELDLMLAEAELKNLRRKSDVPWNWNRHMLAVCTAILLVLAGFGGWYYHGVSAQHAMQADVTQSVVKAQARAKEASGKEVYSGEVPAERSVARPVISNADMRRLVRSAKTELSK